MSPFLNFISDLLDRFWPKRKFSSTVTLMFLFSGLAGLTRNWWESILHAILENHFNTTIPEVPVNTEVIGGILTAVGLFLYLLHRHDEKAEKALDLKKHAIENSEGENPRSTGEFQKLRIGESREMVGREDAMEWLRERMIVRPSNRVAVASVGAGGIGKTFLAHAFAEAHKDNVKILEMTVGERPALQAGIEFLEKNRVNVSRVRTLEELRVVLDVFYDQSQDQSILIVDDVWNNDVQDLLPTTQNWKALLTTRDESLAHQITNEVYALDFFTPEQSQELFRKVLGQKFKSEDQEAYQDLAEWLGHRPYAIRLAAESLKNPLSAPDPESLLQKLKTEGLQTPREDHAEDQRDLHQLRPLLEHCLGQLERQSPGARQLLNALAVCADEGIGIQHFKTWQSQGPATEHHTQEQVEHELQLAQNYGLLFVESVQFSMLGDQHKVHRLRLHTDTLQVLRSSSLADEEANLQQFLHQTLVESDEPFEPKRTLQFQVNALIQRHQGEFGRLWQLADLFWDHFYRTGQLLWAHDLGQRLLGFSEVQNNKTLHQVLLGNQALILKDWGQLEEAMELHQKEEKLCEELGDKAGLQASYGNQAGILQLMGQLEEAMELYQKQEKLCEELGDKAGLSASYCGQALILKAWGQLEKAMELHQKEEKLCEGLGDKAGLSQSYGNQALILNNWGQLEDAMELHQKEEQLCEELGDKAGLSGSYGNQGLILRAWGQLEEAMELHQKVEKLFKELGDKAGLFRCYWNTGLLLKKLERHPEALEKMKASLVLCKELKDPRLEELTKFYEAYKAEVDKEK